MKADEAGLKWAASNDGEGGRWDITEKKEEGSLGRKPREWGRKDRQILEGGEFFAEEESSLRESLGSFFFEEWVVDRRLKPIVGDAIWRCIEERSMDL